MGFGESLRVFRIKMKLSQEDFALRTGVTQQSISAYENGISDPGVEWLIKTAIEFNVSIDFIVGYSLGSGIKAYSEDEIELFRVYDALPSDRKEISIGVLRVLRDTKK